MMKKLILSVLIFISFFYKACAADIFDAKIQKDAKKEFMSVDSGEDFFYHEVPRGLVLSVSDEILFEGNEDNELVISPKAYIILDKIAEILMKITNDCTIEGHTDRISAAQDLEYSIMKADIIADYIIKKYSKLHSRVSAIGFGNEVPISSEVNVNLGNKLNNRIDFVIIQYDVTR